MQLISDEYRKINENLHNKRLDYGTCGHQYSEQILVLSNKLNTTDILDYGCGKCTLANTLPFAIKKYDPAIRAFHEEPAPADIVSCTDVMEHIEPELLDNVLTHIQSKVKKMVYLIICTKEAKKTLEDGRNAHILIHDSQWWFNKISEYFRVFTFTLNGDSGESVEIVATLRKQDDKQ